MKDKHFKIVCMAIENTSINMSLNLQDSPLSVAYF